MAEFGMPLAVVALGTMVAALFQGRFDRQERRYIWACFAAHILSSFALVLLTRHYFGGGDMFDYQEKGLWLSRLLREDFPNTFPALIRLFFHQESSLSSFALGEAATGSMSAMVGLLLFIFDDSFWAVNLLISLGALSGQVAIYAAFRNCFPTSTRRRILIATLLVPSVVFWSSGVLKEAVALAGFGWMVLAAVRLAYGQLRPRHILIFAAGAVLVAHIKAYILVPFCLSAGVIYYWRQAQASSGTSVPTINPLYLVLAALVGIGGMLLVGELFPRFALDNLADEAARLQEVGQYVEGGSNYEIGDPTERSLAGQLAFAPWALITALVRPFLFEANNAAALINSLETTVFLLLLLRVVKTCRHGSVLRVIMSSPAMMMCIVFTLTFSVGVGLATTNMGTMSRYRIPMIPMYLMALLLLQPRPRLVSAKRTS